MSFSENEIIEQLALTRGASTSLALASSEKKNEVLFHLAQLLLENSALIIAENLKDLASISDNSNSVKLFFIIYFNINI